MSARINARLEEDLARKLSYLRKHTAQSTTDVIRTAIEAYFERVAGSAGARVLLQDFVGCARGPSDLSERYKSDLTGSLSDKTFPERIAGEAEAKRKPPGRRRRGART